MLNLYIYPLSEKGKYLSDAPTKIVIESGYTIMRKIKYRKRLTCPVCGDRRRPISVVAEHLKPIRASQPHTQFVITGKCEHIWKMSAEEMGYDTLLGFIQPPLWKRFAAWWGIHGGGSWKDA